MQNPKSFSGGFFLLKMPEFIIPDLPIDSHERKSDFYKRWFSQPQEVPQRGPSLALSFQRERSWTALMHWYVNFPSIAVQELHILVLTRLCHTISQAQRGYISLDVEVARLYTKNERSQISLLYHPERTKPVSSSVPFRSKSILLV